MLNARVRFPLPAPVAHSRTFVRGWKLFREVFTAAGLPYFNPHSFRSTLEQLGERICNSPESFKAWSQNLGHEGVLTTFTSYGQVSPQRQAELIRTAGRTADASDPLNDPNVLAAIALIRGSGAARSL